MAYNRQLYTTPSSAIDAGVIYDQTEAKLQNEVNADIRSILANKTFPYDSEFTILPNNTDLNTIVEPGNYRFVSTSTYTNVPYSITTGIVGMLIVFKPTGYASTAYRTQLVLGPMNGQRIAWRYTANSTTQPVTWQAWHKLAQSDDLSNLLSKTGDTVTGPFAIKSSNIQHGTYTNANVVGDNRLLFQDKNGTSFGYIAPYVTNSGSEGLNFRATRTVGSSSISNFLSLYIDASGNKIVALSDPDKWRTALGLGTSGALPVTIAQGGTGATSAANARTSLAVLGTAGGTMTGNITMKAADKVDGTAPTSAEVDGPRINFYDTNGQFLGKLCNTFTSAGNEGMVLYARRVVNSTNKNAYIAMYLNSSGAESIILSSPTAWRTALGLGTSGALPITVAQGGTGRTSVYVTSTLTTITSDIASAASGFSITSGSYAEWGKVAQVVLSVKTTAATSGGASSGVQFATFKVGHRPVTQINGISTAAGKLATLESNGVAKIWADFAANYTFTFRATYILAN